MEMASRKNLIQFSCSTVQAYKMCMKIICIVHCSHLDIAAVQPKHKKLVGKRTKWDTEKQKIPFSAVLFQHLIVVGAAENTLKNEKSVNFLSPYRIRICSSRFECLTELHVVYCAILYDSLISKI